MEDGASASCARARSIRQGEAPPHTFFLGAAIERRMAEEIWEDLENEVLTNAANLNDDRQVASLSRWLCSL